MVGHAGFHGPPGVNGRDLPAALELAYTVFAPTVDVAMPARPSPSSSTGHGRCTAFGAFWRLSPPVTVPVGRVVTSIGFVNAGQRWDDEDGLELVFEFDAPPLERARHVTGAPAALKHRADREYGFCFFPGCERLTSRCAAPGDAGSPIVRHF